MMATGLLDEVAHLAAHGLSPTARQALGYKELLDHLDGLVDARRGGRGDRHQNAALRHASGAVVPSRPAHTLDRHRPSRRRPARRGADERDRRPQVNALQLVKYHGFGNDFLIGFDVDLSPPELAALARRVCDRRRGVGADGLIIGESDPDVSAEMVLFNADGSRAGDQRQRHPLLRPCPGPAPWRRRIGVDDDRAPTPGCVASSWNRPTTRRRCSPRRRWVTSPTSLLRTGGPLSASTRPAGRPPQRRQPAHRRRRRRSPRRRARSPRRGRAGRQLGDRRRRAGRRRRSPCVSTNVVSGSPRRAEAGPAPPPWPPTRWGLAAPRDGKLVVHMDGGRASVGIDDHGDGVTSVSLSGPTTYVATIELPP